MIPYASCLSVQIIPNSVTFLVSVIQLQLPNQFAPDEEPHAVPSLQLTATCGLMLPATSGVSCPMSEPNATAAPPRVEKLTTHRPPRADRCRRRQHPMDDSSPQDTRQGGQQGDWDSGEIKKCRLVLLVFAMGSPSWRGSLPSSDRHLLPLPTPRLHPI